LIEGDDILVDHDCTVGRFSGAPSQASASQTRTRRRRPASLTDCRAPVRIASKIEALLTPVISSSSLVVRNIRLMACGPPFEAESRWTFEGRTKKGRPGNESPSRLVVNDAMRRNRRRSAIAGAPETAAHVVAAPSWRVAERRIDRGGLQAERPQDRIERARVVDDGVVHTASIGEWGAVSGRTRERRVSPETVRAAPA
jgi:hypothetical protein